MSDYNTYLSHIQELIHNSSSLPIWVEDNEYNYRALTEDCPIIWPALQTEFRELIHAAIDHGISPRLDLLLRSNLTGLKIGNLSGHLDIQLASRINQTGVDVNFVYLLNVSTMGEYVKIPSNFIVI